MASSKITFATVRKMGLAMPGVEEGKTYGSPALKLNGELLACVAIHKSTEPGSLAVRLSFEDRNALISADPDVYYLTDHYVDYPTVLVRMSRIEPDALRDLLGMAWRFVNSKQRTTPGSRRQRATNRSRDA